MRNILSSPPNQITGLAMVWHACRGDPFASLLFLILLLVASPFLLPSFSYTARVRSADGDGGARARSVLRRRRFLANAHTERNARFRESK